MSKKRRQNSYKRKSFCQCPRLADILIVDDNIFNVVALESILKLEFGIECEKANNGV